MGTSYKWNFFEKVNGWLEGIGIFKTKKGIVAFNLLKLKELKSILKEACNDKVAEVQLHIALLCINSNISVAQR